MKIDAIRFPSSEESGHDEDGFPVGVTEWGEEIPCTLTSVTRSGRMLALKSGYQAVWDCHINAAAYGGQGKCLLVGENRVLEVSRDYLDGAEMVLTLSAVVSEV